MRHYHLNRNQYHNPIINVDHLWTLVKESDREKAFSGSLPAGHVPVIDVTHHGYFKVLGKGKLPEQPIIVKAKFFSDQAERRIKAAGGVCVLVA